MGWINEIKKCQTFCETATLKVFHPLSCNYLIYPMEELKWSGPGGELCEFRWRAYIVYCTLHRAEGLYTARFATGAI